MILGLAARHSTQVSEDTIGAILFKGQFIGPKPVAPRLFDTVARALICQHFRLGQICSPIYSSPSC